MTKLQSQNIKKRSKRRQHSLVPLTHFTFRVCSCVHSDMHSLRRRKYTASYLTKHRNVLLNTSTFSRPRRPPTLSSASCKKLANLWQAVVEMPTGPVSLRVVKLTLLGVLVPQNCQFSVLLPYMGA